MSTLMTAPARRELVEALRQRYAAATREGKARILAEFVAVSGYHRKHAVRILNDREQTREPALRRGRPRLYDEAARQALIVLWEASDRICGKRLHALLPVLLPALERHGHLRLEGSVREKLLSMGAATIDRLLRTTRATATPSRRRFAPRLRQLVPVRTFADWTEPLPGSMEIDLVAHCGGSMAGSFVHTLVLTDLSSGWTECVPLVVREGTLECP